MFDKRMSGIEQLKEGEHPGGEEIEKAMSSHGAPIDDSKRRTQLYDNRMSGAESFKEMPANEQPAPVADMKKDDLRWSKFSRRKTGSMSPESDQN